MSGPVCRRCGTDNSASAIFCRDCGEQVAGSLPATGATCARCASPLAPGQASCTTCGSPVGAPAGSAGSTDYTVRQPPRPAPQATTVPPPRVAGGTLPQPSYQPSYPPSGPSAPGPARRGRGRLVAAVLALLLVVGGVAAAVVLGSRGSEPAGDAAPDLAAGSSTPSDPATATTDTPSATTTGTTTGTASDGPTAAQPDPSPATDPVPYPTATYAGQSIPVQELTCSGDYVLMLTTWNDASLAPTKYGLEKDDREKLTRSIEPGLDPSRLRLLSNEGSCGPFKKDESGHTFQTYLDPPRASVVDTCHQRAVAGPLSRLRRLTLDDEGTWPCFCYDQEFRPSLERDQPSVNAEPANRAAIGEAKYALRDVPGFGYVTPDGRFDTLAPALEQFSAGSGTGALDDATWSALMDVVGCGQGG